MISGKYYDSFLTHFLKDLDVEWSIRTLLKGIEENDHRCAYPLACLKESKKDYKVAFNWYNKAAFYGEDAAFYDLRLYYLNGNNTKIDYKIYEICSLFDSFNNIHIGKALAHFYGFIKEKDEEKAFIEFNKAIKIDNKYSKEDLLEYFNDIHLGDYRDFYEFLCSRLNVLPKPKNNNYLLKYINFLNNNKYRYETNELIKINNNKINYYKNKLIKFFKNRNKFNDNQIVDDLINSIKKDNEYKVNI